MFSVIRGDNRPKNKYKNKKQQKHSFLNIANEIENLPLFKAILQCLPAGSFQK